MIEWSWLSLLLVCLYLIEFKLDWIATLLNLKAFPLPAPQEEGVPSDQEETQRLILARDYLSQQSRLSLVEDTLSLFTLLGFWFVGAFGWLDSLLRNWFHQPWIVALAYLSIVMGLPILLNLPFQWINTFHIEQRFGFNRTSPKLFFQDFFRNLSLTILLGVGLSGAVLWILQSLPNAWFWAWATFISFQFLLMWLAPTWILPLLNRFTPMPDGELRNRIEALSKSCGFPLDGVFVMDGSKRSSKANAFFTGFGKRKKIALYDTLINSSTTDEIVAVLAHEIGHFRCGHIRRRLWLLLFESAVVCFLLGWCTDPQSSVARAVFNAFGVAEISSHVGLVLFFVTLTPMIRLWTIPHYALSRHHEYEADAYAVRVTGGPEALTSALQRLHRDHLAHPCPAKLRVWMSYSHPPLPERLKHIKQVHISECNGKA